MSLVVFENCSYKKSVLLFLSSDATHYFFINRYSKIMILNAIRFLLSGLIALANMATILISFQQRSL